MWLQIGILLALVLGAVIGFTVGRAAKWQDVVVVEPELRGSEIRPDHAGFVSTEFPAGDLR
jgi:hypothetical protein